MKQQILQISLLLTCIFVAKIAAVVTRENEGIRKKVESQLETALNIGEVDEAAKNWARLKAKYRIKGPNSTKPVDNTKWSSLYVDLEVQIPGGVLVATKEIINSSAFQAHIDAEVVKGFDKYVGTIRAVGVAVSKQQPMGAAALFERLFNIVVCAAILADGKTKAGNVLKNLPIIKAFRYHFLTPTKKDPVATTDPHVVTNEIRQPYVLLPSNHDIPKIAAAPTSNTDSNLDDNFQEINLD